MLPQASLVEISGQQHLALTCRVNPAASGAVLTVETSTSLQSGTWGEGAGHTVLHSPAATTTGGFQTFTTRANAPLSSETSRYMRLKVTLP